MLAPLAVSVALAPLQIVALGTLIIGNGFTFTVATVEPEHPPPEVPVTV